MARTKEAYMKSVLVTAGSTMVPIDKVRAITNIFNGRTGTNIALYFAQQGWNVTLVTSNPSLLGGKPTKVIHGNISYLL